MKKEEIVDRLKNTQYITSTDDSLGIANRAGIEDSSGGVTPEEMNAAISESEQRIMNVVEDKEDLSNKVDITDPSITITEQMYPTAESVVESLSHMISDEDEIIIECNI